MHRYRFNPLQSSLLSGNGTFFSKNRRRRDNRNNNNNNDNDNNDILRRTMDQYYHPIYSYNHYDVPNARYKYFADFYINLNVPTHMLLGTFYHMQRHIYDNLKNIDYTDKLDNYYHLCVIASILEYKGILTDKHNISWAVHINNLKKYIERYDDSSYETPKYDSSDDDGSSDAGSDNLDLPGLLELHGSGINTHFKNMFNKLSDEALLDWYSHYFGPNGLFLQLEKDRQNYQLDSLDELDTLLYVLLNRSLINLRTFNHWMMRIDRLVNRQSDIYDN